MESRLGEGSTFRFTASFETAPENEPEEPVAGPLEEDDHDLEVLVVDDSATQRRVLETQLREWGYRVTSRRGDEEELAGPANGHRFSLVLLDSHIPGVDVWEEQLAATERIAADTGLAAHGVYAALGPHATDSVSAELFGRALDVAEARQLPLHLHLHHGDGEPAGHTHSVDLHTANDFADQHHQDDINIIDLDTTVLLKKQGESYSGLVVTACLILIFVFRFIPVPLPRFHHPQFLYHPPILLTPPLRAPPTL